MIGAAVLDPERHFATVNCRTAKGSFALLLGAPGQLQSLAGLDHDRTIPSADALFDRPVRR
jgi:hypothetical protein